MISPIMRRCTPAEKLALLDRLEAGLLGANADDAVAVRLRAALAERKLSPKHAQDLIAAFKLDVTKLRYRDWDDLICLLLAVGDAGRPLRLRRAWRKPQRLAGERRAVRRACRSSIICRTARKTIAISTASIFRRTRSPRAAPASKRSASARASPALLACLHRLAERTERLLSESDAFPAADRRPAARARSLGHQHAGASADAPADARAIRCASACISPLPAVAGLTLLGILRGASRRLGRRFFAATQKPRGA